MWNELKEIANAATMISYYLVFIYVPLMIIECSRTETKRHELHHANAISLYSKCNPIIIGIYVSDNNPKAGTVIQHNSIVKIMYVHKSKRPIEKKIQGFTVIESDYHGYTPNEIAAIAMAGVNYSFKLKMMTIVVSGVISHILQRALYPESDFLSIVTFIGTVLFWIGLCIRQKHQSGDYKIAKGKMSIEDIPTKWKDAYPIYTEYLRDAENSNQYKTT